MEPSRYPEIIINQAIAVLYLIPCVIFGLVLVPARKFLHKFLDNFSRIWLDHPMSSIVAVIIVAVINVRGKQTISILLNTFWLAGLLPCLI